MKHFYHKIGYLIIFILLLFLSFYKLERNALWHDEAEVGMIAKQILQTGLPSVGDGIHFLPIIHSDDFHTSSSPYLYRLQTWIMFYVGALGMLVFGVSVQALRIPFVIFGLISLYLCYRLFILLANDHLKAKIAVFLFGFSVEYLILIRAARYYSLVFFFSSLSIYLYLKYFQLSQSTQYIRKSQLYLILFFFSMVGLFHTHYLSFYSFLFAFFIHFLLSVKRSKYNFIRTTIAHPFTFCGIALLFTTVPWIMWFWYPAAQSNSINLQLIDLLTGIWELLQNINRSVPLLICLIGILLIFIKKHSYTNEYIKKYEFLTIFIASVLFTVSIVTASKLPPSIGPQFRYILGIFPLFFYFIAEAIYAIYKKNILATLILLFFLLFTNVFSILFETLTSEDYWPLPFDRMAVRSYLAEFISGELITGYVGPIDSIIAYMKSKVSARDKLFVSSEGISLMFTFPNTEVDNDYTFLRRVGRIITPSDLVMYDWLIFRDACPISCIFENEPEVEKIIETNFNKIELPIYDYIVNNREEIPYHLFTTDTQYPHVVIYKRKFTT